MNNILQSYKEEECCGCGNCINVCPNKALVYSTNKYGFSIPKIDIKKCINCGLCISVCPYNNKAQTSDYLQKAYAAVNKDDKVIYNSSSGGVFYELAKKTIEKKGVVFGAAMFEDYHVKHIEVSSIEEITQIQKSKYMQSDLSNIFTIVKERLKNNTPVLFSGTPCQVTALYSFLNGKYLDRLVTVDFACHGVPSPKMFQEYISVLEESIGKIKKYTFRAKKKPNNGMNAFVCIETKRKKIVRNWNQDSYFSFMQKSLSDRESCYSCHFLSEKHMADITLMDYWHWDEFHYNDFDIEASVSGIVINSPKGSTVFNSIRENLRCFSTEYENLKKYNTSLYKPSGKVSGHNKLMEDWIEKGYKHIHKQFIKENSLTFIKSWIMLHIPQKLVINIARKRHGC